MRSYRLPRTKAFAIAAVVMREKQVLNLEEIWSHDVWESQEIGKKALDFYREVESDGEDDENYEEDDQLNGGDEDGEEHDGYEGYERIEHDEAEKMSVGWCGETDKRDRASIHRTYKMQNRPCSRHRASFSLLCCNGGVRT